MSIELDSQRISKFSSGTAGVGGGTLMVALLTAMPDNNPYKLGLLLAVPCISLLLGVIWLWSITAAVNFVRNIRYYKAARAAKKRIRMAMADPITSPRHKAKLKRRLEEIQLSEVDRKMHHMDKLKLVSMEDVAERMAVITESK